MNADAEDLPEGWAGAILGDIITANYGKALKEEVRRPGKVPVYGSNGVVGQHDSPFTSGPTIIIGRKGSVGAVHLSRSPCWPIDTTYYIEDFSALDAKFVFLLLNSLGLKNLDTSSAIPGLNRDQLYSCEIPLPPLAEQKRIVAKVETLLVRVNAARQRLAKVPALLKRFRQSVLAAACSGQLTEDCVGDDWKECALGDLLIDGAQNGLYKPQTAYGDGTLIVRIDNFYDGAIQPWDRLKRLRLTAAEASAYGLRVGDILVNRVNSMPFLGKSAIVPTLQEPCVFESNMMRLAVDRTKITPNYLVKYLTSLDGLVELRKNAKHAVNQASINQKDVAETTVPLPPLAEQHEIVRRVEALLARADRIEKRLATATRRVETLTQAILAQAFRGELVPTEAELARREGREFDSASALLERLRTTAKPAGKTRQGSKKKQ